MLSTGVSLPSSLTLLIDQDSTFHLCHPLGLCPREREKEKEPCDGVLERHSITK